MMDVEDAKEAAKRVYKRLWRDTPLAVTYHEKKTPRTVATSVGQLEFYTPMGRALVAGVDRGDEDGLEVVTQGESREDVVEQVIDFIEEEATNK